ncbi:unnamed protein product [Urochloa humidicola]
MGVQRLSPSTFLLRFDSQQQRNEARNKVIEIGHTKVVLMPWIPQVSATVSKFLYRARLCIEGIPSHLHQIETVASLFKNPVFIDDFDCGMEKPEEESCVRLWVWTSEPEGFARTATLQVLQPVTPPED